MTLNDLRGQKNCLTQLTLQVTSFNSEKDDPDPAAKPDSEPQISVKELSILYEELLLLVRTVELSSYGLALADYNSTRCSGNGD